MNIKTISFHILLAVCTVFNLHPTSDAPAIDQKPIVVIVPSYNNRNHYQRNLDSIVLQNYTNYHVIYIDDVSPDGTGALVRSYIQKI